MSVRSFRPVMSVATVAVAALGCYLVSLRVAAERAGVEDVETRIVLAQRDIRSLQTEIGTRGRLAQLERWNVKVLALSAPKADQFVDGGYQLARLARPSDQVDMKAPVVLASAPKPATAAPMADDDADVAAATTADSTTAHLARQPVNRGPASIMHVASYSVMGKPVSDTGVIEKISRKSAENVSSSTKSVEIATMRRKPALPGVTHDAKASSHHNPAHETSADTSRDKATH